MDSKEQMYLQRAQQASDAAEWAETSGIGEMAKLYRKIALLWRTSQTLPVGNWIRC